MKNNHTPKHFALQLGSLISLYLSLTFLLVLLFGIINLMFPDATENRYLLESASNSVRLGIAMLIVSMPTYLILTRAVNKLRRSEVSDTYLTLTRWLIYLSLIVGIGALLVDLVVIIKTFLEGEVTDRFIFKAAAVIGVIGVAVHYYIFDARGYWLTQESKSIMFAIGAGLVSFTAIGYGFASIDSPATVREIKLDHTQITDLQNIQWKLQDLIASSSTLPDTLTELYEPLPVPTAPETRPAYTYQQTATGFDLCATFSNDALDVQDQFGPKFDAMQPIQNGNDWYYTKGNFCFHRLIKK